MNDLTQHLAPPNPFRTAAVRRWLCAVLLLWTVPANATFEVLSGATRIVPGAIVTEADLDLKLSDAVIEAIDKGIELHIVANLRLLRVRAWLWNEVIGEWQIRFRLKYHDLSSTYVMTDDRTGELEPFTTIRDALDSLASLSITLPVVTETLPETSRGYRASLRVDIDRESLPPPLKLITEITPSWRLGSQWNQWTVVQ